MSKRRWIYYIVGMCILAFGLELNAKTGLGVSAIISVAYANAILFKISFPDMTLILYMIFVCIEIIVHIFRKQSRKILVLDVLQIPLSIVFTRFMKAYEGFIPDFTVSNFSVRLIILMVAVICTGIGAAMTLNMRIVPNPGDGLVMLFIKILALPKIVWMLVVLRSLWVWIFSVWVTLRDWASVLWLL